MLIENPEALRTWLTNHLKPLCDADPAALDKYVEELRETMVQQMDVFLQGETLGFIDVLFNVVHSKEYEAPTKLDEPESEPEKPEVKEDTTAEEEEQKQK